MVQFDTNNNYFVLEVYCFCAEILYIVLKAISYLFLFCFLLSCSGVETLEVSVLNPPVAENPPAAENPPLAIVPPSKALQYSVEERVIPSEQNPILITGHAFYESVDVTSAIGDRLRKVTKPIRHAQVSVFKQVGSTVTIVQNSQTGQDGSFSFLIPANTNLLLIIYARTQGLHGNISVEDTCQSFESIPSHLTRAPARCRGGNYTAYSSNVYALQKAINISESNNAELTLTASFPFDAIRAEISASGRYNGELLGGAFHILDNMVQAVDFLTEQVGDCSAIVGCENFVTSLNELPLLKIYWRPGFSLTDSPVSFYNRANAIVILGGLGKDPLFHDSDHFDASVILHEFAHYLEDHWGNSSSLGGYHSGGIIDPRLAWSEGFANFFQAAVLNRPEYKDFSFSQGTLTLTGFAFPLENQTPGVGEGAIDILNPSAEEGEGNFREFSIARLLWDSVDSNQSSEDGLDDSIFNAFSFIWASLTHPNGFKDSSYFLRSMGLFNKIIHNLLNQSWPNLLSLHKNTPAPNFRRQFGANLEICTGIVADPFSFSTKIYEESSPNIRGSIRGRDISTDSVTQFYTDYLHNYDIFSYTHSGGVFDINVNYTVSDLAIPDTLKLIVVKHNSALPKWNGSDVLISTPDIGNVLEVDSTVIEGQVNQSVSGNNTLAAGTYMIILIGDHTKTTSSTVNYSITINSNNMCLE